MLPEPNRTYNWDEFRAWEREERWELVDGIPYAISSPSPLHQAVAAELQGHLWTHFRGRPCRVFSAPLDVKLSQRDVVQPDLLVVCRAESMQGTHIEGPPDLVVEILSPSSVRHDRIRKLNLYAQAGVGEYWLVTPYPFMVEVLHNQNGSFQVTGAYTEVHRLISPRFPDLNLELGPIYAALPYPDEMRQPTPAYSTW